jgi:iron complex outermembrane receptor protein
VFAAVCVVLLRLALAPAPATAQIPDYELDSLSVTVESRTFGGLRTRAVEVLTAEVLGTLPVRSLAEALRWALGTEVSARSPAQADLSIRGSSFEQVVVLVNGVRMSDPQTGHFDLDLPVPLERVARIEILRGPAASLYGSDAVGGVVNVITRAPEDAGIRGRVDSGSFAGRSAAVAAGGQLGGLAVAAGVDWSRGNGHREGTDFDVLLAHGEIAAGVAGGRLSIEGGWADRDFGADGFYAPFGSYEETDTKTLSATWRGSVGGMRLRPRVWRRTHDDDFILKRSDPAFYRNVHSSRQTGAELVARRAVGSRALFALGGEFVLETMRSSSLGDRDEHRVAGFGEGTFLLGEGTFRGSLRVDDYEMFGAVVTPSVSASMPVGGSATLRGGAGRAFRAPTWTERYYEDPLNKGRADLDPERATTFEVGADFVVTRSVQLEITAFTRRADDLIDWARRSGTEARWETTNVERATFNGLEVAFANAKVGPLTISASGSLLSVAADEIAGYESKYALRPTTRQGVLGVLAPMGEGASAVVQVMHANRRGDLAHTTLDLRVAKRLGGGEAFAEVRNAFDSAYLDITRMTAPGRTFSVGLRYVIESAR